MFTGRESYFEQLDDLFKTGSRVALCGLGGIGKTQLALEYAHRCHLDVYPAILWVDADQDILAASYADLAKVLELPVKGEPKLELEVMEPDEGLLFLLRRSDKLKRDDLKRDDPLKAVAADMRAEASQLLELLGRLPLALDQAGAYIAAKGKSFAGYIRLYQEKRRRLLEERGKLAGGKHGDHPASVAVTFDLCFREAQAQHPLAIDILHFCSFLHPDAILEELFEYDGRFQYGSTEFDDGIEALQRYSLLKYNTQDKAYSLHRLVQVVAVDAMPPELQRQWRERVIQALYAGFPILGRPENRDVFNRFVSHVLACTDWTVDQLYPSKEVAMLAASLFIEASAFLNTSEGRYVFIKSYDLLLEVCTRQTEYHPILEPIMRDVLAEEGIDVSPDEPLWKSSVVTRMLLYIFLESFEES